MSAATVAFGRKGKLSVPSPAPLGGSSPSASAAPCRKEAFKAKSLYAKNEHLLSGVV